MLSEIWSVIWPLAVICVVLFIFARIWIACADVILAKLKKLLGLHAESKEIWHSVDDLKTSNDDQQGDIQK